MKSDSAGLFAGFLMAGVTCWRVQMWACILPHFPHVAFDLLTCEHHTLAFMLPVSLAKSSWELFFPPARLALSPLCRDLWRVWRRRSVPSAAFSSLTAAAFFFFFSLFPCQNAESACGPCCALFMSCYPARVLIYYGMENMLTVKLGLVETIILKNGNTGGDVNASNNTKNNRRRRVERC